MFLLCGQRSFTCSNFELHSRHTACEHLLSDFPCKTSFYGCVFPGLGVEHSCSLNTSLRSSVLMTLSRATCVQLLGHMEDTSNSSMRLPRFFVGFEALRVMILVASMFNLLNVLTFKKQYLCVVWYMCVYVCLYYLCVYVCVYVYLCVCMYVCVSMHVLEGEYEDWRATSGLSSLLPPHGSQESNSSHQARWLMPLPTELSHSL